MNLNDAKAELKQAMKTFRAFEKMADVIEVALVAEAAALQAEKKKAELLEKMALLEKSVNDQEDLIGKAKAEAETIVEAALKDAEKARAEAAKAAHEVVEKANTEKAAVLSAIDGLKLKAADLEKQCAEKAAELDKLTQAAEKAKAQFKGLLG